MPSTLVGIGHCCQDSICTVEDYPMEDGSTHILQIDDSQGGGAVATALVAAAKLGTSAGVLANLGDDAIGSRIVEGFTAAGVDTSLVRRIPGGRSSSSIVMVNPQNGSRTKFPYRDSLPPLVFDPPVQKALGSARLLHLDGTQYQNALAGAKLARKLGVTVSLDGCSMQQNNEDNRSLVRLCDIVITNAKYPFRVTGKQTLEAALEALAALGPSIVGMTAGKDGCYLWQDGQVLHIPPFSIQAVDTTGAGDVFHGAFLSQWLLGDTPVRCAAFASAAAAKKCLRPGGRAGIPTRQEAKALWDTRHL